MAYKKPLKKPNGKKRKRIEYFFVLSFLTLVTLLITLGPTQTRLFSFGQEKNHQGRNSLQLDWFLPTASPSSPPRKIIPLVPHPTGQPAQSIDRSKYPPSNGCGIGGGPILKKGSANGKCCVEDGPVESPNDCCPSVPFCDLTTNPPQGSAGISCQCSGNGGGNYHQNGNGQSFSGTCGGSEKYWCNAKPVIYLYPESPTTVDVTVTVPGEIFISDPLYPQNGWQNVQAYPDGKLLYQGKSYSELFYEARITPSTVPQNGIVVPAAQVEATIKSITTSLGLNDHEQKELLAYWLPSLRDLQTPYVLISVFPQEQKERIDHVEIKPQPDTFLQMILYFKGLTKPIDTKPLLLPATPPERHGFTAVEWGGIIDAQ